MTTAVIGLLAAAALMRIGSNTLNTTESEGFVRRLALDMRQARRAAIATGDDHYVRLNRDAGGKVIGYDLLRDTSGADTLVQPTTVTPNDTAVITATNDWAFDFSGALTAVGGASSLQIDGTNFEWNLDVIHATGIVRTTKTAQP